METSQVYVIVGIVLLGAVFLTLLLLGRDGGRRLTPLAGLAFAFVLAGLFFGDEPWLGYILLGIGIALAVVDIVRRRKASP